MVSVHLLVALALTTATMVLVDAQDATPLYRQANAQIDARVTDLLGRMTLEEKVAQLVGIWNRKREITHRADSIPHMPKPSSDLA